MKLFNFSAIFYMIFIRLFFIIRVFHYNCFKVCTYGCMITTPDGQIYILYFCLRPFLSVSTYLKYKTIHVFLVIFWIWIVFLFSYPYFCVFRVHVPLVQYLTHTFLLSYTSSITNILRKMASKLMFHILNNGLILIHFVKM